MHHVNRVLLLRLLSMFVIIYILVEGISVSLSPSKTDDLVASAIIFAASILAAAMVFAVSAGWQMLLGDRVSFICTALLLAGAVMGIVGLSIKGAQGEYRLPMFIPILAAIILTAVYRFDYMRMHTTDSIREEATSRKQARDRDKTVI